MTISFLIATLLTLTYRVNSLVLSAHLNPLPFAGHDRCRGCCGPRRHRFGRRPGCRRWGRLLIQSGDRIEEPRRSPTLAIPGSLRSSPISRSKTEPSTALSRNAGRIDPFRLRASRPQHHREARTSATRVSCQVQSYDFLGQLSVLPESNDLAQRVICLRKSGKALWHRSDRATVRLS
jgi:hypothetical protein